MIISQFFLTSLFTFIKQISQTKKCAYFQNEVDVGGEGLHSVETGNESNGQEALLIHFPPQEEVPFQVIKAEVVLTTRGRETGKHICSIIQTIYRQINNCLLKSGFQIKSG